MEYLKCINVESKTFFKKDFTYLFLERGEGRKRGRETSMRGCLSHTPTGHLTCNPGMCPDWESNQWPFGSQASTQSTEPQQPGQNIILNKVWKIKYVFHNY